MTDMKEFRSFYNMQYVRKCSESVEFD